MANRVLLSPSGLKISNPGVDVLSATASQLMFNSDWSQLKLLQRIAVTVPSDYSQQTPLPPIGSGRSWTSPNYNYSKAFGTPPLVLFSVKLPSDSFAYVPPTANQLSVPKALRVSSTIHTDIIGAVAEGNSFYISVSMNGTANHYNLWANAVVTATVWDYKI